MCALNTGARPIALPDGEVLLTSGPLVDGKLPPNTAAWLVCSSASRRKLALFALK